MDGRNTGCSIQTDFENGFYTLYIIIHLWKLVNSINSLHFPQNVVILAIRGEKNQQIRYRPNSYGDDISDILEITLGILIPLVLMHFEGNFD